MIFDLGIAVALSFGACATSTTTPSPPAPAPDVPAAVDPQPSASPEPDPAATAGGPSPWNKRAFQDAMHQRFAYGTDAVYGVILGDVDLVHAKSKALAALPPPTGLPEGWSSYLDALRVAAERGAETPTIVDAAADVVTIGRTCANCHVSHGGPHPTLDEVKSAGWSGDAAMLQHSYGAYLMWLGTLLPSEAVYSAGADEILRQGPLPSVPAELLPLEARVQVLATQAKTAVDAQERASVFADVLRVCADCHSRAGAAIPR